MELQQEGSAPDLFIRANKPLFRYTRVHYSAVHCSVVHISAVLYSAVFYDALHYSALHCSVVQYFRAHYTSLQHSAVHCSVVHRSTVLYRRFNVLLVKVSGNILEMLIYQLIILEDLLCTLQCGVQLTKGKVQCHICNVLGAPNVIV